MQEINHPWSLTSTGRGTAYYARGFPTWWTFYLQNNGNSTATVAIESAIESTGPFAELGTRMLEAGETDVIRLEGPLLYVAPRAVSGSSIVVRAVGN